jgi:hypothetical protein
MKAAPLRAVSPPRVNSRAHSSACARDARSGSCPRLRNIVLRSRNAHPNSRTCAPSFPDRGPRVRDHIPSCGMFIPSIRAHCPRPGIRATRRGPQCARGDGRTRKEAITRMRQRIRGTRRAQPVPTLALVTPYASTQLISDTSTKPFRVRSYSHAQSALAVKVDLNEYPHRHQEIINHE